MTKLETLQSALTIRQQEVDAYQLNIDNYTIALEMIEEMTPEEQVEQSAFKKQLINLLASEKREQSKSKIMLKVLEKQIESFTGSA